MLKSVNQSLAKRVKSLGLATSVTENLDGFRYES